MYEMKEQKPFFVQEEKRDGILLSSTTISLLATSLDTARERAG